MAIVHIRRTIEAVPRCGSFEVWYEDGRESVFFYYEDIPGRRLRPEQMTSEQALEQARAFARTVRDEAS